MSALQIAPDLELPLEAVTETFAILAKRGAGKSNTAVVMAEQMYDAGLPWVAIDPKGDWWGIRSSRDGKGEGLPVLVLGGQHGDVPLEATAGRLVADLVVDQRLTCVVDVSLMSKADARRFLTDFAERLYQANTDPLHVFAEEAHEYIPQRVTAGDTRMVGAWEKLVKWGRTHGLGVTLITQRSASLNNDVLTQVETLIAMRTTGPSDQRAVRAWVDEHDSGAAMMAQLRKLENGEAFVLSPQWLELDEPLRIRFAQRRTFDSGATPKAGQKRQVPRTLAEVDLAALTEAMADTIEKAKADDPKALRTRIQHLERELQEQQAKPATLKVVTVPVLPQESVDDLNGMYDRLSLAVTEWAEELARANSLVDNIVDANHAIRDLIKLAADAASVPDTVPKTPPRTPPVTRANALPTPQRDHATVHPSVPNDELTGPMRRVLDALAWLEFVGFAEPTKTQAGFIAGYRVGKKVGGSFGNTLGQLRGAGLVSYPTAGTIALTPEGRALAAPADIEPTTEGLQRAIFARLADPEQRVLQGIVDAYPESLTKQEAGERAGYTVGAKVGGSFGNTLGRLRSLGLVDYPTPGQVIATNVLFL